MGLIENPIPFIELARTIFDLVELWGGGWLAARVSIAFTIKVAISPPSPTLPPSRGKGGQAGRLARRA
ncbi:hypothetical protein D3C71_307590 [compost metagenome]